MKTIVEKSQKTMRENPKIREEGGKKLSIALRKFYKFLYENDTEETHYLYIMENYTKPIIKIGICAERRIEGRTNTISRDFGESKPVLLLKSTYKKIFGIESYLHEYLAVELASSKLLEC
jgi:hypothetical protein